jgi:hypothetical protein
MRRTDDIATDQRGLALASPRVSDSMHEVHARHLLRQLYRLLQAEAGRRAMMSPVTVHVYNAAVLAVWTVFMIRYAFPWLWKRFGIPSRPRPRLLPTIGLAVTLAVISIAQEFNVVPGVVGEIARWAVLIAFWVRPSDDDDDGKRKKRLVAALRRAKSYLAWGVPAKPANA